MENIKQKFKKVIIWSSSFSLIINIIAYIILISLTNQKKLYITYSLQFISTLFLTNVFLLKMTINKRDLNLFYKINLNLNGEKYIKIRLATYILFAVITIILNILLIEIQSLTQSQTFVSSFTKNWYKSSLIIVFIFIVVIIVHLELIKEYVKESGEKMNDKIKIFSSNEYNNNNVYLILNENKTEGFLIDAGPAIIDALKYIKSNKIDVKHILFTHFHFDHTQFLNNVIDEIPNIKPIITKFTHDYFYLKNDFAINDRKNIEKEHGLKINYNDVECEIISKSCIKKISGINVEIQIKQGHTPDTTFFYISQYDAIFVGDTVFYKRVGFHHFEYTDIEKFKKSILDVLNIENKKILIYSGHWEAPFTVEQANEWNLINLIN